MRRTAPFVLRWLVGKGTSVKHMETNNEELKNILAQLFSDRHYTIVLALAEEVDFEALNFPPAHYLKRRTNLLLST